jgi:hypothetical protein
MKWRIREGRIEPLWLRILAITALGLLPTLFVWSLTIAHYPGSNGGDGPFFYRLIEAGKVSINRWGEVGLWNPYECGGVPLWDNPQSLHFAPEIVLLHPLDTSATIAIWVITHCLLGFVGMWLLCRDELGTSRIGAFVGASIYAFSATYCQHIAGGHTGVAAWYVSPLAIYMWRRGETSRRAQIGLGIIAANLFYESGVYGPALIGLMLALETFTRFTSPKRVFGITKAALVVMFVALTLGAARVIPIVDQGLHHTRFLWPEKDAMDLATLKTMYLDRFHARQMPGHDYVWGEYRTYTGPLLLGLGFAGMIAALKDKRWITILGVLLFLFMLGHVAPYAPWAILKHSVLPYKQMRVPSRFNTFLIICIGGWVALAVDRLPDFLSRMFGRRYRSAFAVAVVGLAFLGAGDVAGHSVDIIASEWNGPAFKKVVPSTRLHIGGPGLAQFIDQPRQNRGRHDCWEEWIPYDGETWDGDVPQAKPVKPEAATVYSVLRTQNKFFVDVEATEPTTILFNTSYGRGWRSDFGTVKVQGTNLAVEVPAGHHKFKVWYWPQYLTLGIVLTIVGLIATILMWRNPTAGPLQLLRRRPRERAPAEAKS